VSDRFAVVVGSRRGDTRETFKPLLEKTYGPLPGRLDGEGDTAYRSRLGRELDMYRLKLENIYGEQLHERDVEESDADYGCRMLAEWGPIGPLGIADLPDTEDGSDYYT
jgi:hypothetical protein